MAGRHHRPITGRRRLLRWMAPAATGAVLIAIGGGLLAHPWVYRQHAQATAKRLVHQLHAEHAAAVRAAKPCTAPAPSHPTRDARARMVLTIPTLGLTAPVLTGTSDRTLDMGIGHVDASTWPDQGGTTVLAAHNVTFFSHLPRLRHGAEIHLTTPCRNWTYRVTARRVGRAGTPVTTTARPRLVLVTCWPTNALFYTNQRYLVTANLVRATPDAGANQAPVSLPTITAVLPAALTHADMSATKLRLPLGRLHLDPRLDPSLLQSSRPLQASHATVALLGAALQALSQHRSGWWHAIAPDLSYPGSGPLARVHPEWQSRAAITVIGAGTAVNRTRLDIRARLKGTSWRLTMITAVRNRRATIAEWRLHRLPTVPTHR